MSDIVRKQFCLDADLNCRLKEQAEQEGVSESEIIRRALRTAFGQKQERPEREAWRTFKKFCEERSRLQSEKGGRQWKREDLYEDRIKRKTS